MPVDTSMYANIQQPTNPLQTAGQVLGIKNQLQQNQLLQTANQQQQLNLQLAQQKQAVGQILANRIQPDGSTDYVGAMNDVKQANLPFPELVQDQMQKMLTPVTTTYPDGKGNLVSKTTSTQDSLLARNRKLNAAIDITGNLLSKRDISDSHVINGAADLLSSGALPAPKIASGIANLPTDPVQRRQVIANEHAGLLVARHDINTQDQLAQPPAQNQNPLAGANINAAVPITQAADMGANQQTGQDAKSRILQEGQRAQISADAAKEAISTLNSGVTTGKFAPWTENGKAYMASIVGEKNVPDDTNDAAKMQIFAKQLATVQAARGEADTTDLSRLNTAAQNADITKLGPAIAKVLQYGQGQFEAKKGLMLGMQKTLGANPNGAEVNDYVAKVNAANDPAIYRYMLMTPAERKDFQQENFSGKDGDAKRQAFVKKADALKSLGVLDQVGQ